MFSFLKRKTSIESIVRKGVKLISLGVTGRLRRVVEEGEKLTSYNVGVSRVDIYEYEGRGYYIINEPQLSPREVEAYYRIINELYFSLKPIVEVEPSKVINEVFKTISKIYRDVDVNKIKYYVVRDTLGYGPLDVVMNDPKIEDISGEGVNRPIRVFHRDFSYLDWLITNIVFESEEDADRIVLLLAHKARRHISTAFPIAEGTLPEKHRIVVTYGYEVTPFGSGFTVRKFREEPLSIAHLIKFGTISSLMAAYWWIILENKGSVFIVGEMASGKTTLMNALLTLLPPNAKIVTIEDTPELRLPHIGWKPLVARHVYTITGSKATEVSLFDLVKLALRERATFIAIGEIRGEEAYVFIQAIASGHGGACLKYNEPLVIKENGLVRIIPIGKLVDKVLNCRRLGNIKVLSFNPTKGLEWKRISRVYKVDGVKKWIKIVTKSGRIIEVTSDHIIPVIKDSKVEYKVASKVRIGDGILVLSSLPIDHEYRMLNVTEYLKNKTNDEYKYNPIFLKLDSRDIGFIMGLYLTRGNVSRDHIVYHLSSIEVACRVRELFERVFKLKTKVENSKHSIIVRIESSILAKLFKELFGVKDRDIPDLLINTPREFRIGIVEGYLAGCGYRLGLESNTLEVEVASKNLAYKLHYLLKTLGVDSSIVELSGDEGNNRYYKLRISYNSINHSVHNSIACNTLIDYVVEVKEYISSESAYDIEVECNHTFIHGCSIITHNCTFHGDSIESMVMRLTTPPINVPLSFLPLISNVIITRYIRIPGKKPMRRAVKVYEITGLKSTTELNYKVVFEWDILSDRHYPDSSDEVISKSVKLKRIAALLGWTEDILFEELERRRKLLQKLVSENKLSYSEVALAIQNYYKEVWRPSQ